jgi:replicative DNA helicase
MNEQTTYTQSDNTVAKIKVPPHSVEAEQSVLGGVMLEPEAWDKVVGRISEEDLYLTKHKIIFQAILGLIKRDQAVDVLTLSEALKSKKLLEQAGGEAYLFELARNTPSLANISAYADIIRERSVFRQLIGVSGAVADRAYNPSGSSCLEVLDEAERKIFAIAEQGGKTGGPEDLSVLVARAVDKIDTLYHSDNPITGLSTGFTDLDAKTAGLQDSDLIIVAGRPSMGKTMLGINIAEHAAVKSGKPVLVFSMEMPGDGLAVRMLSSLGRIDQTKLRTGRLSDEDWPRITSTMNILSKVPMFIDDSPALTPGEVRARARRVAREHGQLAVIVVDYLQLMRVPGLSDNRVQEVSEISRSLKALAKELKVPVVALSQLNRGLEQRADKRPVMSDLRESGAIEQDADLILFLYRDEVYNEDSPEKGVAEVIIGKQRNGPIGRIKLKFFGQYSRFENHIDDNFMDDD